MPANDALEAVIPVLATLRRLGVKHYPCGSLASTFHGIARATADVDIVAELSQSDVSAFAEAIRGQYYVDENMISEAIAAKSRFNVIYLPASFKVDVFVAKDRRYDKGAMERIEERVYS